MSQASSRASRLLAAASLTLLSSCGDADVVGVQLTVAGDGSGQITVRSLQPSTQPSPAEAGVRGVQFEGRAQLMSSTGAFAELSAVQLGGIRFTMQGPTSVRVHIPTGPDAAWPTLLAPRPDEQGATANTFDPSPSAQNLGATVRLALDLPSDVVSLGCYPAARGVEWEKEKKKAYIWIPVATALREGDDLLWDVSWK